MSDLIDMPEFSLNLVVAAMALIMIFWARPERLSHRMLFGGLTALVIARYVVWRITETLPAGGEGYVALYAWVFLFFEMVSIVCALMSIQILMGRRDNRASADQGEAGLRRRGMQVPAVDVFICTYNEDLRVLEKTIIGAQAIDYPHVNIWVLDDTRRDWLRDYCAERGVHYARRPDNKHAKAGNLNSGLRLSAATTNAPYILVLDADFVPHRNIVYRALGLFAEPTVGLVQTPQFYYNADPIQHNLHATDSWVDEQRVFFDVLQPAKDATDAAFCVGTSFVVRRDVITGVGGFPTGSVCEDIFTTYTLLRHGWVTRWLNERLSNGLSAESIVDYINQRSRWCLGTIQVALLPDGPIRGKGYSLTARMHFIHGLLHWLSKPFMMLILAAPAVYWFFGMSAFYATPRAFAAYGLPSLIVFWAYSYWINQRRSLPLFTEVTQVVAAMAVTRTIASALVRPFGRPFKVTAKGLDRSKIVVHWNLVAVFGGLMLATELGALRALGGPMSTGDTLNMIWSVAGTIYCLAALAACVDRPRPDQEERFPFDQLTSFRSSAGVGAARFVNIAADGARLRDSALLHRLPVGQALDVHVPEVGWISARVARHTRSGAELRFDCDASLHERLVRYVFTMPPSHVAIQAHLGRAVLAFMTSAGWRRAHGSVGALRRVAVSIAQPLIALAGLLMLSGCNLTPPLKPADLQVPAEWPVATTTTPAGPVAWTDFVVDDELHGMVATALAQNRDLRVYAAKAREARAAYAGTRSSLFPEFGATAFAERSNVSTALGPSGLVTSNQPGGRAGNTYGIQAGVTSYELDFFGHVGSTVQQAGSQAQASDLDYAAARINLVGEVCNAYLTLRADRALLALAEAQEKAQTDSTRVMTRARSAGGASEQDVYRSQSLVQSAQVLREEFQIRVGQDLQWLTVLVGQPVPPTAGTHRVWPDRSVAEIPAGLPSSLLRHRPDLLAAYARVEAANAGIGAAKAEFLPTFSLTALGGGISTEFSHVLSGGNRSWAGLLGVSLPIFDWGRRTANLNANEARLAAAMATYEHAAQQAFRETADALIADSHLRPQLDAQQARVESLTKVASISQMRFQGGLEDYFASLDAQRELYNEQRQWIELQLRKAVNTVNLYKALGGGWSEGPRTSQRQQQEVVSSPQAGYE